MPRPASPNRCTSQLGAAATPSITFAGDTTTGFLHISSGYIGLAGYFLPAYNATYDLGSSSYNWNNLFLAANATVGGEVYVSNGSSSTPSYSFTNASTIGLFDSGGSVAEVGNFIAGTDATYNLGASSTSGRFANAYFSGALGGNTVQVGGGAPAATNVLLSNSSGTLLCQTGNTSAYCVENLKQANLQSIQYNSGIAGSQPACASGTEGLMWFVFGGAGVQDSLQVCGKDQSGAYSWVILL